ncbi:MAG: prepilin-type N-terminal cleavage/methylation domain-containing protein [Candidatus Wallbacteria bacterium]|nr:prepilin-type N-terminal cleavage/methylation domain-containing protein [Candidatus Wallbacteria bacterium]
MQVPRSHEKGHHGRTRPAGFTMVELIVAIVIGAVLMGVLYDMFYAGSRINRDTQNKADALQAATLTLASVQQDLKQLVSLPVAKQASGENNPRYGDHRAPVRISPMGRNITFYVPDPKQRRGELPTPGAVAVTYSLDPADGGLFRVKRTIDREETDPEPPEEGARAHTLPNVHVRDVRFRLLDPKSSEPDRRSPDQNYYVETVVTGADATGRETMTLLALTELENPSTFVQSHNKFVNETVNFQPRRPLPQAPDKRSATQKEFEALRELRELAEKFEKGEVGAKELEDQVRRVVEIADGNPGRKDLVATNGRVPPLGNTPLALQNRGGPGGRPIEFSTPNGDRVLVPTNRDQTRDRLIDEIARRGAGGGGNIRIVMTDVLETFRPDGGGSLEQTGAQGRRRTGNINFSSDAGTDFSKIHNAGVGSMEDPTRNFFRGFGLPYP